MSRRTILAAVLLVTGTIGAIAWINRAEIVARIALYQASSNRPDVAPHRPVKWDQGPDRAIAARKDRPPNIVFILFDDLGYNDLATLGGGVADASVPTPNIDRLAREGALYTQAYSGTATCAPSRAMLMTGRYPTRTGFEFTPTPDGMSRVVTAMTNAMDLDPLPEAKLNTAPRSRELPYEAQGLPESEVTIAELLQQRGYHTVHIGKWHLGRGTGSTPNAQGFDESLLMHSGMFLPEDHPDVVNARLDFDPIDRFLWAAFGYSASFNGSAPFAPGGYLTDWWTDESLKVIEANANRPFFLYLAHWAPHTPLQATRADYDAVGDITPHRLRVYAAMIRALDRSVGRIMTKLESEGLSDDTLLVLSSDNGGAGYIGLPRINAPYRGWKVTLFEGGIRVPMLLRWPAHIAPGTRIDTPVAHIDMLPTLAAASGTALPKDRVIDGRNILVEATGEGRITREDDAIYWQSGKYRVVRAGDWKLQVDGYQGKSWLFDLADDPTEQVNLRARHPQKAAQLQALLDRHHAGAVEPLYPHKARFPVMVDKTVNQVPSEGDEYVIWAN